jgi:hypothetical protein
MEFYYVNNDSTYNPGYHHEVHTEKHANELMIKNKTYLGYYSNCYDALNEAKKLYHDADGCAICCPLCHRG